MLSELDAKLQKRKLDALKRGIHHVRGEDATPYSVHVVGLGKAGCNVVAQVLRDVSADHLSNERVRLTALAIDIGDRELAEVRQAAKPLQSSRVQVETIALGVPTQAELQASLSRHREFLRLEYPLYHANPHYRPWIGADFALPALDAHVDRLVAKAIYSRAYYDGERSMAQALRRFRNSVEATPLDSVVCIVFGLGGGSGSGMAVDLARHLSNIEFGQRVVVVGVGIAPCDGDESVHRSGSVFTTLSEIDCMLNEAKNRGVTAAFGDLYRNPFTGGFIVVPQQPAWHASQSLEATHTRVDSELGTFLIGDHGTQLWETLRFLNWVAAPSTQHSAARTPYGSKWMQLWNFLDLSAKGSPTEWLKQLGVRADYRPEIAELRSAHLHDASRAASEIDQYFKPEANTLVTQGGRDNSAHFILPRLRKTDLEIFFAAQDAYDAMPAAQKVLAHSWLVDLGIVLCEPGTHLQGMAGAGLWNDDAWVAVPYDDIHIAEQQCRAAA